jgi:hypothetical protein
MQILTFCGGISLQMGQYPYDASRQEGDNHFLPALPVSDSLVAALKYCKGQTARDFV